MRAAARTRLNQYAASAFRLRQLNEPTGVADPRLRTAPAARAPVPPETAPTDSRADRGAVNATRGEDWPSAFLSQTLGRDSRRRARRLGPRHLLLLDARRDRGAADRTLRLGGGTGLRPVSHRG